MSKLDDREINQDEEINEVSSREENPPFRGIITNLDQVLAATQKAKNKSIVKRSLEQIKSLMDDPDVELRLFFQIYGERYECINKVVNCKKSEVDKMIQKEYNTIAKIYDKADKVLIESFSKETINFSDTEGPSLRRALMEVSKKNKKQIYILEKLIRGLTLNFNLFGKDQSSIIEFYRDNLIIYPKEYLIKALQHRNYKKFPTLNEIEEYIRKLDGARSEFLYQINGYSLFEI